MKKPNIFQNYRWWVWLMVALVFFFGLVGRLYDLNDPPLDFHPTRQLHAMIIARGMYYENLEDAPEWQRELAVRLWKAEGHLEPPILESLVVVGYRLVGSDDFRVPRLLSISFWTLGGLGLFLLLKGLVGEIGAVVGLAYYFVLPFPLIASRSFQPDPLMTALIIWSWWGAFTWVKKNTWLSTVVAGLLGGLAILVKAQALFFVLPVFLSAILVDRKFKRTILDPQVWALVTLLILPFLVYYLYGMVAGSLQGQLTIFTNLLTNPFHYLRWKDFIDRTVGIEFFLIGLFGTLTIKDKKSSLMFFSVFVGYLLFGLVFAYHMASHDYYQIPLTPIIAIGLAAAAASLIAHIKVNKTFALTVLSGLLFFWMSFNFWDTRMTLKHAVYREEPKFYAELGDKVRNYSVVSITPDYGFRLSYWGWKQTTNWLSEGDFHLRELAGNEVDREILFSNAIKDSDLFLVTDFWEFDQQAELKAYLTDNFSVYDEGEQYLIFDLRSPLPTNE